MAERQFHAQVLHAGMTQLNSQTMSGSLAAAIPVGIEAYIDEAVSGLAKPGELAVVEMRPQRRNGIFETRLPQCGHIE